jgi:hypothetical protein
MNAAKQLQKQRERCACDRLINHLGLNAQFERYGNDIDEPDCIYKMEDELLGIEMSTAYPEDKYAKRLREHISGERIFPKEGELLFDSPICSDELMKERIQNRINEKCCKNYAGANKIWLCIEEENPFSDEASVEKLLQAIVIPEKHYFQAIYLLHLAPSDEGGNYKAFKICGD